MKKFRETKFATTLIDKDIFADVGNIIKNEVFRVSRPNQETEYMPSKKLKGIFNGARSYSFDFYEFKKVFRFGENRMLSRKPKCPRCNSKIIMQYTGKRNRLSFFCTNCQSLFEK